METNLHSVGERTMYALTEAKRKNASLSVSRHMETRWSSKVHEVLWLMASKSIKKETKDLHGAAQQRDSSRHEKHAYVQSEETSSKYADMHTSREMNRVSSCSKNDARRTRDEGKTWVAGVQGRTDKHRVGRMLV